MSILFARHGESEANIQYVISNRDLPHKLTPVGVTQAADLAERVASRYDVTMIGTSPILRAKETAKIVSDRLGLPYEIFPGLREFDCGGAEGRSDAGAWAIHNAVVRAWKIEKDYNQYIPPDGESFNDMKSRFLPLITRLIEKHQQLGGDILLISHGGLLNHMLPLVITNIDQAFTSENPLANCELITIRSVNGQLFCAEWGGLHLH